MGHEFHRAAEPQPKNLTAETRRSFLGAHTSCVQGSDTQACWRLEACAPRREILASLRRIFGAVLQNSRTATKSEPQIGSPGLQGGSKFAVSLRGGIPAPERKAYESTLIGVGVLS